MAYFEARKRAWWHEFWFSFVEPNVYPNEENRSAERCIDIFPRIRRSLKFRRPRQLLSGLLQNQLSG